jgi:hypothetical protein
MKGWYRDNYRHSLAARHIRTSFYIKRTAPETNPERLLEYKPRKEYINKPMEKIIVVPGSGNETEGISKSIVLTSPDYDDMTDVEFLRGLGYVSVSDRKRNVYAARDGLEPKVPGKVDNIMLDWMKDTADYMFRPNDMTITDNILSASIKDSWKEWFNIGTQKKQKEILVGGMADNMPDEVFEEPELSEGITVEMEHTNDPDVAKEVAKDHIAETGYDSCNESGCKIGSRYYNKLEEMEKQLK